MRKKMIVLVASTTVLQILIAGTALAGCNWEAEAVAGIGFGGASFVESTHFGRITRVDCINSRSTSLQHRTLMDGDEVLGDHKTGPPATLGAHIGPLEYPFGTCSGNWSSTTKFGTTYLGIRLWYAEDLSGIYPASCTSGDGGGCGGTVCEDGCA